MVTLLGRTGSFVAAGMHIMLLFTGSGGKAPIRRTRVSRRAGRSAGELAERVSAGAVGQTDDVMLR
jgi:hypothetical protein